MQEFFWNPWHGCHKCSPGCLNCYVYFLDSKRDIDASVIKKNKTNFDLPLKKNKKGEYKIPSGSEVATCFTTDFFLIEADEWRIYAWEIIKKRTDLKFLICTKRIERFFDALPDDWGSGYDNVSIAVTCENNEMAKSRLPYFLKLPIKHKYIFISPILEYVDLKPYFKMGKIDMVSVGGESYENARVCDFNWVKKIYQDCVANNIKFDFHQTGSNFLFENKLYKIRHQNEHEQARRGMKYLSEHI